MTMQKLFLSVYLVFNALFIRGSTSFHRLGRNSLRSRTVRFLVDEVSPIIDWKSVTELQNEISKIFTDGKSKDVLKKSIKTYVDQNSKRLSHNHAISLMFKCARERIDISECVSLVYLTKLIEKKGKRYIYKPREIANALYGLKSVSPDTSGYSNLLVVLSEKVLECRDKFKSHEIGNALYGLQHVTDRKEEVRLILIALTINFSESTCVMKAQDLAMAFYGLRLMSSANPAVRGMLRVVTQKLISSDVAFTQHQLGLAINGLQHMTATSSDVSLLLQALTAKLQSCPEELSAATIGSILMGLRSMDATSPAVTDLLTALSDKINQSTSTVLDAESIGHAVNGLRSLRDADPAERALIAALAHKIEASPAVLTPHSFAHAASGLRLLSGRSKATQELLQALLNKIDPNYSKFVNSVKSDDLFTGGNSPLPPTSSTRKPDQGRNKNGRGGNKVEISSNDLGRLLYGFQSMNAAYSEPLRNIFSVLTNWVEESDPCLTSRDLAQALYGLKSQRAKDAVPEVEGLVWALVGAIGRSDEPLTPQAAGMSLYGLRGQLTGTTVGEAGGHGSASTSSNSTEISSPSLSIAILDALRPRITALDAQGCGNALFALKDLTGEQTSVRLFLQHLTPLIREVHEVMGTQEFSNAFFGLQGMDSKYTEVVEILSALREKLVKAPEKLNFVPLGISAAFFGFQTMSDVDSPDIPIILGILADRLESCTEPFKPQHVADILFGLQGMSSSCDEVRAVLQALLPKMQGTTEAFEARDIGYCLVGMSSMQPLVHEEARYVLEELNVKVAQSRYGGQPLLTFMQYGKGIKVKLPKEKV